MFKVLKMQNENCHLDFNTGVAHAYSDVLL